MTSIKNEHIVWAYGELEDGQGQVVFCGLTEQGLKYLQTSPGHTLVIDPPGTGFANVKQILVFAEKDKATLKQRFRESGKLVSEVNMTKIDLSPAEIVRLLRNYEGEYHYPNGLLSDAAQIIETLLVVEGILREVEWAGMTWEEPCCPICGAFKSMDLPKTDTYPFVKAGIHRPDCRLALALGITHEIRQS